ncbi:MAG: phosphatase PAP2 family protein [Frankiaceae bacterium]
MSNSTRNAGCPRVAGQGAGLADPRVRLLLGATGIATTAAIVRRDRVGPRETQVFHALNTLPNEIFAPVWLVMQGGSLGSVFIAGALAGASGQAALARRILLTGSTTWALSKAIKRGIRRPRPAALLPEAVTRGRAQTGLGYLSGHAGVALAVGIAAYPHLGQRGRLATTVGIPLVWLSRIYVGAHLPLDVVGGAGLGLAIDAAIELTSATRNQSK